MGYEVAAVGEIEKELMALEEIVTSSAGIIEKLRGDARRLAEMTRNALNGDTCG
ncbi:MAG: hypothetical protein ACYC0F_19420 [Rhodanobacter sp.]